MEAPVHQQQQAGRATGADLGSSPSGNRRPPPWDPTARIGLGRGRSSGAPAPLVALPAVVGGDPEYGALEGREDLGDVDFAGDEAGDEAMGDAGENPPTSST